MVRAKLCRFLVIVGLCALAACSDTPFGPPVPPPPAPVVIIEKPPAVTGAGGYSKVIVFGWGSGTEEPLTQTRCFFSLNVDTNGVYSSSFDLIGDMNRNPWRYESKWTPWKAFEAPGDSGKATVIGDDEALQLGRYYVFAVQGKDRLDRVTGRLETATNARRFQVKSSTGPVLYIYEKYLVGFKFIGTFLNPEVRSLPPGIPLSFRWTGDASYYGGEVAGYRYAWDVVDLGAWDAPFEPALTQADEVTFAAGVHTLYVETLDRTGVRTRGRVTINVAAWPMDQNLLFVDDYLASASPVKDYSNPSESQHDAFWLEICSRAEAFDPSRDVYDSASRQFLPPGADVIGRYKNIIWEYSSASSAWSAEIRFVPESEVGKGTLPVNYLSCFLMKGGHLWTLGRSERAGGLGALLPVAARVFPVNLQCEVLGNKSGCGADRSGATSFGYRDYCVSVLDKVDGQLRTDGDMPRRQMAWYDCMSYGYRDPIDALTLARPGLPGELRLWDEVTKPGRYFDPNDTLGPGGFTYVEVYDPSYAMARNSIQSQLCFHPMYRMRAVDDGSALDGGVIAVWVTKYESVVPDVRSGIAVAAPSVHFGFPLWFFQRSEVDSIVDVVLDEWGIRKPR